MLVTYATIDCMHVSGSAAQIHTPPLITHIRKPTPLRVHTHTGQQSYQKEGSRVLRGEAASKTACEIKEKKTRAGIRIMVAHPWTYIRMLACKHGTRSKSTHTTSLLEETLVHRHGRICHQLEIHHLSAHQRQRTKH